MKITETFPWYKLYTQDTTVRFQSSKFTKSHKSQKHFQAIVLGQHTVQGGHKLQKENFQDAKFVHESQMIKEKTSKIQTSYIRGPQRTQGLQNTNFFRESQINNNEIPQK